MAEETSDQESVENQMTGHLYFAKFLNKLMAVFLLKTKWMVYLGFLWLLALSVFSRRQGHVFRMMHELQKPDKQSPKGVFLKKIEKII